MTDREQIQFKDCVDVLTGFPFRSTSYSKDGRGTRLLRGDNIGQGFLRWDDAMRWPDELAGVYSDYQLETGDIVVAMDRPWIEAGLKYAVIGPDDSPSLLVQRVARLRAKNGLDQRFLRYLIASPRFTDHVLSIQTGTSVPHISAEQILAFRFDLPPAGEQHAISRLLAVLDDKIDLNRKLNETIEAMLRTLFDGWFLAPARTVIWPMQPLGEHIEVVRGLSYIGAGLVAEGVPLHNLDSVREGGGYKHEGIKYYAGEFHERHLVRPGDLVVANTEQGFDYLLIGCPAVIPGDYGKEGLFSHHLFRVRPHPGSPLTPPFLYLLLCRPRFRGLVTSYSNGTTVNMLAADGLRRPKLAVPPAALVARFDELTQPLFARQAALHRESTLLARLRDILLPRLLSGELRVRQHDTVR